MSSKSSKNSCKKDITKELKGTRTLDTDFKRTCENHRVILLSDSNCPYSDEAKQTLASYGVSFGVVETNLHAVHSSALLPFFSETLRQQYLEDKAAHDNAMKDLEEALGEVSARETGPDEPIRVPNPLPLPSLIVNGRYFGTLSDLKNIEHSGDLSLFYELGSLSKVSRSRVSSIHPLFQFPDAINAYQASVTAAGYLIISAVCIAYWQRHVTMFAVLGLAIDLGLYALYGPSVSVVGMIGVVLTCLVKPVHIPGGPKQVGVIVNTLLATLAAGLFLGRQRVGGCIVLGIALDNFFLETLGICVGSALFGIFRYIGLAPRDTVRLMIFNKGDRDYLYQRLLNAHWMWKIAGEEKSDHSPALKEPVIPRGQHTLSDIDLQRKQTSDPDYKYYNYGFLRFARVDLFLMPMSSAALAYAFSVLTGESLIINPKQRLINWDYGPRGARDAIGIASAVLFCGIGAIFIVRLLKHPVKVIKEWNNPTTGNYFCALPISTAFYALLMYDRNPHFAVSICWIAVVFQMVYTVLTFSNYIFRHTSEESINASLLLIPIGNFVCSAALAQYPTDLRTGVSTITNFEVNYIFIARFWFSVGTLFAIVLFTLTLLKSFKDAHADPRVRSNLWNWQATAAIAGPAFYAITGNDISIGKSFPYQALWLIAVFFFAVNCIGWFKHFYALTPDMSIWLMAFATSCGAISTAHYYAFVSNDQFSEILTYIAIVIACANNALCLLHSFQWFLEGSLFKPKEKWGPATYLNLTNEAFRTAATQLQRAVDSMEPSVNKHYTWAVVLDQLVPFLVSYKGRTEQELGAIYPAIRRVFPGLDPSLTKHTPESKTTFDRLKKRADELKRALESASRNSLFQDTDGKVAETVQDIKKLFGSWVKSQSLLRLTSTDITTSAIVSKYFSLERQKQITRQAFDSTDPQDWHIVLPFVVTHIAHPEWRVRYLRCLLWAIPERAEEIGLIAYRTFDSITFATISEQLPEIIPRGLSGYSKKY